MPQSGGPIQTDPTVQEGGTIRIQVRDNLEQVLVSIPGIGRVRVQVSRGLAEYRLPPGVQGGTVIFVSDGQYPNPTGTSVRVVGGSSR